MGKRTTKTKAYPALQEIEKNNTEDTRKHISVNANIESTPIDLSKYLTKNQPTGEQSSNPTIGFFRKKWK